MLDAVSDPKQRSGNSRGWYRYYAGYSPQFVADALDAIGANRGVLLDPWMGAGTSLAVGARRGLSVVGVDLNPAMVVVSKARLLAKDTASSIRPLAQELIEVDLDADLETSDEPLSQWFDAATASRLRSLASRIDRVLVDPNEWGPDDRVDRMSSLASIYYVALFAVVKSAVRGFQSKNPTWTKKGLPGQGSLVIDDLPASFGAQVTDLIGLIEVQAIPATARNTAEVLRGDTRDLAMANESVDFVVSSPPYCTRLDYVVGHRPELACLGYSEKEVDLMRRRMIGTPTVSETEGSPIGVSAQQFVASVENHAAYASANYYANNFRQYFEGMSHSLTSIDRVSKGGASIVLVVQDSRYKDIHLDLAQAMLDMATPLGWKLKARKDFTALRSMASVNVRTSSTNRKTKPIESVLHFTKAK